MTFLVLFFFKNAIKLVGAHNIGVTSIKKIAGFNPIEDGGLFWTAHGDGVQTHHPS